MPNFEEGYIKYKMFWEPGNLPPHVLPGELIDCRNRLKALGLIGVYADGIGYGNISARVGGNDTFIISGTQTGHLEKCSEMDFSLVSSFDTEKNELHCRGPVKASSEALTHGAIYKSDVSAQVVIHVHHSELWTRLLHTVTTIDASVHYGTPAMANAITQEILHSPVLMKNKIFVTAGHKDGVFVYGKSFTSAYGRLMKYFNAYGKS